MKKNSSIKALYFAVIVSIALHISFIYFLSQYSFHLCSMTHLQDLPLEKKEDLSSQEIEKSIELQLVQIKKESKELDEIFIPVKEELFLPLNHELEIYEEKKQSFSLLANAAVNITPFSFNESLIDIDKLSLVDDQSDYGPLGSIRASDIPLSDFEAFSNFRDLSKGVSSDDFNLTLEYSPKRFKPGYVFKITLFPKKELSFKKMPQHFFFLIDRSNSIPAKRYELFKKSVSKAIKLLTLRTKSPSERRKDDRDTKIVTKPNLGKLGEEQSAIDRSYFLLSEGDFVRKVSKLLEPDDTFNILVFDDKIVRLSSSPLPFSEDNCRIAEEFLQKQRHGGFLAATDLYSSLGKIIPQEVSDNEVNTALLLSDGDTYLNLEKKRLIIGQWTQKNRGKVTLFSVATGEDNNLPLLELLSHFNRGSLFYISDPAKFEEKFLHFVTTINKPIGKSLHATAIAMDENIKIVLYPPNNHFPNFYEQKPLTIVGSINRLSDFTLIIQGRYYEKPFRIKKTVSFENGVKGTLSLERLCVQYAAEDYYELFLQDGKISHLEDAKNLLHPFNLSLPLR